MATDTIALALGSGGARGLAHIGVIRCLVDRGYTIDYIAGCSMGALVGGIYAAGKLDEFEDWVRALDRTAVLRLLDWSFSHGAIFKGERIIAELKGLIGDVDIAELDVGFTVVATELRGPREVWFNRGSLWHAVRASIAVPLVFAPVQDGERTLVDGGLVNPVPIAPTFMSSASLTLAVDLNAPRASRRAAASVPERASAPEVADDDGRFAALRRRVAEFIGEITPGADADDEAASGPRPPSAFELAVSTMDAMQSTISRMKLAASNPELVVEVPRGIATFFEFYRAGELIDAGYERTAALLERNEQR